MISSIVYMLCAATSTICAILLYMNYRRSRTKLLFWSGVCFTGLALNNIILVVDLVLTGPTVDLTVYRALPAAVGLAALVSGFAWDTP